MLDPALSTLTLGSGSYLADDVHFLLRPVNIEPTDVQEKERLIQTRQRHYSEMISREEAPSATHMGLFECAMRQNGSRMATDVQALALALTERYQASAIALVSFVRAGLPLGVLLRRALVDLGRHAYHYGISIIRDRGIDQVALEAVIEAHGAENIVFVDGWTGKGAIAGEIQRSLAGDGRFQQPPRLVVLADPCGRAWMAASAEDWIIPCGILGATVSGLVSRSIWPRDGGLHGCVVLEHLQPHDVTRRFVERIESARAAVRASPAGPWSDVEATGLQRCAADTIAGLADRFGLSNPNRIKPGIAEATRAVLRRVPDQVLVRSLDDADVQLLVHLAGRAGVEVMEADAELGPYRAVTIIKEAG